LTRLINWFINQYSYNEDNEFGSNMDFSLVGWMPFLILGRTAV